MEIVSLVNLSSQIESRTNQSSDIVSIWYRAVWTF